MSKRYWTLVTVIALAAAAAGLYLGRSLHRPSPLELASGTALPSPAELAAFSLVDTRGARVTPAELRGHPTLVFFGFTHCPDICPTTLAMLAQVRKQLALPGLRIALITVDPERDTPEQLGRYVTSFGADFIGLTGDAPEIVNAQRAFGVAASRVELAGGGYTMDHSATVFLLDDQARKVAVFTPPLRIDAMTNDLRALSAQLHTGAGS